MSDTTGVPIGRPVRPGSWVIAARSEKVASEWREFMNQAAGECNRVYDQLETNPAYDDGDRQHPLEGESGRSTFQGKSYQRWQIDITSGGRMWYLMDPTTFGSGQKRRAGVVILDKVHFGHPKSLERKMASGRRPVRG